MDDLYRVALRAVFAFVVLHALLRASGKRTVSEGTAFDFVLALILGDMIDDLLWSDVAASRFVVAVGTLALAHTAVSLAAFTSPRWHRLITGAPDLVVPDGPRARAALRRERLTDWELEGMLRGHGLTPEDRSQVREARIETPGHASVLKHERSRDAQRRDVR